MKKILMLLFILLTPILFSCNANEEEVDENAKRYEILNEYYDLYEIYFDVFTIADNFDELNGMIETDTNFVFTGKPSCPYCQMYIVYVAKYAKENDLSIIYYNSDAGKDSYYSIDDNNKTVLNQNSDYYKFVTLLAENDSNITSTSSDKSFCKLATLENGDQIPWLYVPRLFRFENGIPTKSCFTVNRDANTDFSLNKLSDELVKVFEDEMKESTK